MTNEAASDSSHATTSATSSGRPGLPTGCNRASSAATSGRSASIASDLAVAIEPRATALQRIPIGP